MTSGKRRGSPSSKRSSRSLKEEKKHFFFVKGMPVLFAKSGVGSEEHQARRRGWSPSSKGSRSFKEERKETSQRRSPSPSKLGYGHGNRRGAKPERGRETEGGEEKDKEGRGKVQAVEVAVGNSRGRKNGRTAKGQNQDGRNAALHSVRRRRR